VWAYRRMGVSAWEKAMGAAGGWDLYDLWDLYDSTYWSYRSHKSYPFAARPAHFFHADTPIRRHAHTPLPQPGGKILGPVGYHHVGAGSTKAGRYL
jgi:hypothetical protein